MRKSLIGCLVPVAASATVLGQRALADSSAVGAGRESRLRRTWFSWRAASGGVSSRL